MRCLGFGPAARRKEGEYPWWIFDRRATPPPGQRPATLRAAYRRAVWRCCFSVIPTCHVGFQALPVPVRKDCTCGKHSPRLARRPAAKPRTHPSFIIRLLCEPSANKDWDSSMAEIQGQRPGLYLGHRPRNPCREQTRAPTARFIEFGESDSDNVELNRRRIVTRRFTGHWHMLTRKRYFISRWEGIRGLNGKPTRFSNGELALPLPDMMTGLGGFLVAAFGSRILLIFLVRFYKQHFRKSKTHDL